MLKKQMNVGSELCQEQDRIFFLFLHTTSFSMCMCIYIIVSKRIVIEGGMGVLPQNFFFVIFIQNGAILGNSYWYTCLDIMPQQEGRLPI